MCLKVGKKNINLYVVYLLLELIILFRQHCCIYEIIILFLKYLKEQNITRTKYGSGYGYSYVAEGDRVQCRILKNGIVLVGHHLNEYCSYNIPECTLENVVMESLLFGGGECRFHFSVSRLSTLK